MQRKEVTTLLVRGASGVNFRKVNVVIAITGWFLMASMRYEEAVRAYRLKLFSIFPARYRWKYETEPCATITYDLLGFPLNPVGHVFTFFGTFIAGLDRRRTALDFEVLETMPAPPGQFIWRVALIDPITLPMERPEATLYAWPWIRKGEYELIGSTIASCEGTILLKPLCVVESERPAD